MGSIRASATEMADTASSTSVTKTLFNLICIPVVLCPPMRAFAAEAAPTF
jgi:hypothetical protein